jgi:hypothetical protein
MAADRPNEQLRKPSNGLSVQDSADVADSSGVGGASVKDSLDILLAATGGIPFTLKGDLVGYDGAAIGILPAGADGLVLKTKASEPLGLEWAADASSMKTYAYVVAASGGDYTKLSTLLTAHPAPVSVFIKDGVYNESAAPVVIPANTTIVMESPNAILDMGAGSLTLGAQTSISNGTVRGTLASADLLILNGNYAKAINMQTISTAVGNPAAAQYMIYAPTSLLDIVIENPKLVFAGDYTKERGIHFLADSGRVQNPYFVMPAGAANNSVLMVATSKGLTIDGAKTNAAIVNATAIVLDGTGGRLSFTNSGSRDINANLSANATFCDISNSVIRTLLQVACRVSNCTIQSLTNYTSVEKCYISNCDIAGAVNGVGVQPKYVNCYIGTYADSATGGKTDMSNVEINGTLSILSDYFKFSGRVNDTVSVDADRCSISGYVKEIGVLGSYNRLINVETADTFTITISGGTAVSNMVIGCSMGAAFADTGTTTVYTAEDNVIRP